MKELKIKNNCIQSNKTTMLKNEIIIWLSTVNQATWQPHLMLKSRCFKHMPTLEVVPMYFLTAVIANYDQVPTQVRRTLLSVPHSQHVAS